MAKVSILIAAYNVEKYISEAIHSALNQTLRDIEIIVVDDASTDNTKKEISVFDGIDDRLRIIYLEQNQGLTEVRRTGVNRALGEYIMFLDGDDTLSFEACEKAYDAIKTENTDILQFGINTFTDNKELYIGAIEGLSQYLNPVNRKIISKDRNGLLNKEITKAEFGTSLVSKIYKREILAKAMENLPQERIILAEDMLISYIIFLFSQSYSNIEDLLYNYRFGVGVSTKKGLSREKMKYIGKMWYIYKFLDKWLTENSDINITGWVVEKFKTETINVIGGNFLINCPENDRQYFEDCILKYCSMEEYVYILIYAVYINKTIPDYKLSDICSQLQRFNRPAKEVKTIGTFYYRMNNGGIENVISNITDIWVKSGYNVVIFTDKEPNEKDYYINSAVKRVVLPEFDINNLESCENRIKEWGQVIKQYNIDTVVYHAWVNNYMTPDLMAIKSAGSSLIMHTHGPFCIGSMSGDMAALHRDNVRHKIYRLADVILTLGNADQAYWSSHGFRSIKVINPVNKNFDNSNIMRQGKNVLFVGRISWEKQVLDAVKAVEIAKQAIPDIKLIILGKAENKDYLESIQTYVKNNKLENTVEFAGFHLDVQPYYDKADVMLCTSIIEGQSIAMIESKVNGLPLVSYEIANMDMVCESRGMIVVPQGDYKQMAVKIVKILQDDSLREYMAQEARQSAIDMYSVDLSQQWNNIFRKLTQPKSEVLPVYKRPALEIALALKEQMREIGIKNYNGNIADNQEAYYYKLQCNALNATIEEIRSSTSYKIGTMITSFPRKIKNLLKR